MSLTKKAVVQSLCVGFAFLCSNLSAQVAEPLPADVKKQEQADLSKIKHPIKPLLWSVQKAGLEKTAYLFGTIHVSDPRVTTLHPSAQEKFKAADRVYTEIDMSPQGMVKELQHSLRGRGGSLSKSIGQELTAQLDQELKQMTGGMMNAQFFDKFKTIVVAVTLPQLIDYSFHKQPLDLQLWNKATNASKTVKALEDSAERMAHLDRLTEKEQITFLKGTLENLKKARLEKEDPLKLVLEPYLRGDAQEMAKLRDFKAEDWGGAQHKALNDKFFKILLDDRNKDMLKTIDSELTLHPKKRHFFAAGAMHFVGPKSVVDLLRKEGYTVTRITN